MMVFSVNGIVVWLGQIKGDYFPWSFSSKLVGRAISLLIEGVIFADRKDVFVEQVDQSLRKTLLIYFGKCCII